MIELDISRTYDFPSTFTFENIVDKAFRRLGIPPNMMTNDFVRTAREAANLEMRQWESAHTSLYLVQREMFDFVPGQVFYEIPSYVYKPLMNEAIKICHTRQNTFGTASASDEGASGSPANCFLPGPSLGLTQLYANGWIEFAYDLDHSQEIWYVGILSLTRSSYTLNIEYSLDDVNWTVAKACPTQEYNPLQTRWWVLDHPPVAPYWRIREAGGATLAIQQIFFDTPNPMRGDLTMGRISRASYLNYTNKINPQMTPSQLYFNEKINKSFYVYGNDYTDWNGILYDAKVYPQDVTELFKNVECDQKFYLPLVCGISYQLAFEYDTPNFDKLERAYQNCYNQVIDDDGESTPLIMRVNLQSNWNRL